MNLKDLDTDIENILNIWSDNNPYTVYNYLYYKEYMIIVYNSSGKIIFEFINKKNIVSYFLKKYEFNVIISLSYDIDYFKQNFPNLNYYLSNLPSEILIINKKELEKEGYEIRYDVYVAKKIEHLVRQEKIKKLLC